MAFLAAVDLSGSGVAQLLTEWCSGSAPDPFSSITGMTYERPAILKWLETRRHDPCTKAPLRKRHLAPNLALRGVIEAWVLEQCKKR